MYETVDRPRYMIPGLAGIYAGLETYSWPLIRVATGLFFMPHGMQKLFGFWGGEFWVFTTEGAGTQVTEFDPVSRVETPATTLNPNIIGAGVSTCAPQ